MTTLSNTGNRVAAALRSVLPESIELDVAEQTSGARGSEFNVDVRGNPLRVMWVSKAWLGVVEDILSRPNRPDILVGERVPPASRRALEESGIGWVETSGDAQIETDFLVVSRGGEGRRSDRGTGNWTPAVLGVAEAVLAGVKATVSATHDATGLSVGSCTKALRLLADLGFLEADARRGRNASRRLSDTDLLLDAYVAAAHDLQPSLNLRVGASWRDAAAGLVEIGHRWNEEKLPWAATGLVAASIVAPLVTSVGTAEVYVAGDTAPELELAASVAGLRPIEGGRVILAPFPTETAYQMATTVDGLKVVPWPRLVADLRRSGVRGEEAAEHVKETLGDG